VLVGSCMAGRYFSANCTDVYQGTVKEASIQYTDFTNILYKCDITKYFCKRILSMPITTSGQAPPRFQYPARGAKIESETGMSATESKREYFSY
jgi:hypothetical protein